MRYAFDQTIEKKFQNLERKMMARSLNLGGSPYGLGGPPGGFIGYLPQDRVSYDADELETSATPPSGVSIVDNLNHIRYRIGQIEGTIVGSGGGVNIYEDDVLVASDVTLINFEGEVSVVEDSPNAVTVSVSISGVGTDELVKVSANDTTAGYLNGKLISGTGITLTELNNGSNETLRVDCTVTPSGGGSGRFDEIYYASDEPDVGDYTWDNQDAATAVNNGGGIFLYAPPDADVNYRVLYKALPSPPYTIEVGIIPMMYNMNYERVGICLRQSSDGMLIGWGISNDINKLLVWYLISSTEWQGEVAQEPYFPAGNQIWFKIYDDSSDRYYSWSMDGYNWMPFYNEANDEWLTADGFGLIIGTENSNKGAGATYFSIRVY